MHFKGKFTDNNDIISYMFGEYFSSVYNQKCTLNTNSRNAKISDFEDISNLQFTIGEIFDNLNRLGTNITPHQTSWGLKEVSRSDQ